MMEEKGQLLMANIGRELFVALFSMRSLASFRFPISWWSPIMWPNRQYHCHNFQSPLLLNIIITMITIRRHSVPMIPDHQYHIISHHIISYHITILTILTTTRRHSVPMICHSSLAVPSSSTLAPSSYSLNIITGFLSLTFYHSLTLSSSKP